MRLSPCSPHGRTRRTHALLEQREPSVTKKPQSLLLVMSFATVFLSQACSCDPSLGECEAPLVDNAGTCCNPPTDVGLCEPGFFCEVPIFDPANPAACGVICESACIRRELQPGTLSQQLDVTQTASGTVMLSGYSPGDGANAIFYRDLVVGEYDPAADAVEWEIIDGTDPDAVWDGFYAQDSWRDGIRAPGPDVGRYSSIVANGEDLIVSYEGTSTRTLKVAVRNAGAWTTHVVDDIDGDIDPPVGLPSASRVVYTSIALDAANLPVIAYGVRQSALDALSQPTGLIRIARATVPLPTQTSDWSTPVDLVDTIVEIGCLQGDGLCHEDATCVSIGTTGRGHCVPTVGTGDCAASCGDDAVCDNGTCAPARTIGDLMDAQGLYNNLVRTEEGFGLVWYDRSVTRPAPGGTGNIVVAGDLTGGNTLLRTAGAVFTDALIGRPIEIAGLPGRRIVLTVPTAATLTFSGVPAPASLPGATYTLFDSTGGTAYGMRFADADADWSDNTRFAIQGYQTNPPGQMLYGDCGIAASLFVQPNAAGEADDIWHITFVDGSFERLRYVTVNSANAVTGMTTVDDGYPGANRPSDRPMLGGERRLVGDGSSIVVSSDGEVRIGYHDSTRVYPIIARCTTGCTAAPVACVTSATCGGDSQCNMGFCSNVNWVSAPAITLPEDANASPNSGYYTVQILDLLDATNSIIVWLERVLQPDRSGNDTTQVDRIVPPMP